MICIWFQSNSSVHFSSRYIFVSTLQCIGNISWKRLFFDFDLKVILHPWESTGCFINTFKLNCARLFHMCEDRYQLWVVALIIREKEREGALNAVWLYVWRWLQPACLPACLGAWCCNHHRRGIGWPHSLVVNIQLSLLSLSLPQISETTSVWSSPSLIQYSDTSVVATYISVGICKPSR